MVKNRRAYFWDFVANLKGQRRNPQPLPVAPALTTTEAGAHWPAPLDLACSAAPVPTAPLTCSRVHLCAGFGPSNAEFRALLLMATEAALRDGAAAAGALPGGRGTAAVGGSGGALRWRATPHGVERATCGDTVVDLHGLSAAEARVAVLTALSAHQVTCPACCCQCTQLQAQGCRMGCTLWLSGQTRVEDFFSFLASRACMWARGNKGGRTCELLLAQAFRPPCNHTREIA